MMVLIEYFNIMLSTIKNYFVWKRAFSIKKFARECQNMDHPGYYKGKHIKGT